MSFDELGKLQCQPWAERIRVLSRLLQESRRHPCVVRHFEWIWPERSQHPGHVDRAKLILDDSRRVDGAITEVREDQLDSPHVHSQFIMRATENSILGVLAGSRMAAKAVGPHTATSSSQGAACEEEFAKVIEQVAGKGKMQWRLLGVDCFFGGFADGLPASSRRTTISVAFILCLPLAHGM